jgi:hypothetical protein
MKRFSFTLVLTIFFSVAGVAGEGLSLGKATFKIGSSKEEVRTILGKAGYVGKSDWRSDFPDWKSDFIGVFDQVTSTNPIGNQLGWLKFEKNLLVEIERPWESAYSDDSPIELFKSLFGVLTEITSQRQEARIVAR